MIAREQVGRWAVASLDLIEDAQLYARMKEIYLHALSLSRCHRCLSVRICAGSFESRYKSQGGGP